MKKSILTEAAERFVNTYRESEKLAINNRKLAEEIKKDLLDNFVHLREYFYDYEPASVVNLLFGMYPHMRLKYTNDRAFYETRAAEIEMPFRQEAELCLMAIQHKKLFNMQCLWRAERIKPKGADIVYDFQFWDENPYNCPFLPPIEEEEVDILLRFLRESPSELLTDSNLIQFHSWQHYEAFKIQYAEDEGIELEDFYKNYILISEERMPPWYEFYDTYMGTTGLLALPDLRGPKESHYRVLVMKYKEAKKTEKKRIADNRRSNRERKDWLGIGSYYEDLEEMVEAFETPENKKLFANYIKSEINEREGRLKEDVEYALYHLWAAREPVPMDAGDDWKTAIMQCYHKYRAKKIIEAIPLVFEEYRMCIESNIALPPPENLIYTPEWINGQKQEILLGRKLAGEPEDFNY